MAAELVDSREADTRTEEDAVVELAELETRHQTLDHSRAALERELLDLDRRRQLTEQQTRRAAAQAQARRAEAGAEAQRIHDEAEKAAASVVARASAHAERLLAEAARERDRAWQELLGQHEEARAEHAEAVVTLGRDIVRLQTTVHELQSQRVTLDTRIAEMRSELRMLDSTRTDAERMREQEAPGPAILRFEHDHIVGALREEALRLRSEIDGLGFERDRLQSNLSALALQVNALELRRSDADSSRIAAAETVDRLRGEAERQAEAMLQQASAEAARLRTQGQTEADALRGAAEQHALRRRAESDEVIATLLGRAEQAREELAGLEARRAADAQALEDLRSELVDLERRRSVAAWSVGQEEARRERVRAEAKAEAADISSAHDEARQAVLVACQQAEEILEETDAEIAAMAAAAASEREHVLEQAWRDAEALRHVAVSEAQLLGGRVVGEATSVLAATIDRGIARLRMFTDHAQAWAELERLRAELASILEALERGDTIELASVATPEARADAVFEEQTDVPSDAAGRPSDAPGRPKRPGLAGRRGWFSRRR